MKKCEDFEDTKKFPDVERGDTVRNKNGKIYLACCIMTKNYLFSLENGRVWSSQPETMWGRSQPSDWEKVECCFKLLKA